LKIEIKEKPWDLLFVVILNTLLILTIVLIPGSIWQTILGLPFLLFLPGYVLISFLFPEDGSLDHIERIALSFGLSVAITSLIGLLLNFIYKISMVSTLYSISLFIYTFSLFAYLNRRSIPAEELYTIEFEINQPDWENYDWIDKALVIATVVLLIASGGLAYRIATTPRTGERFTEFGILGEGGMADDYPTNLTVNESGRFSVVVINREYETVNYTLAIGLGYEFEKMNSFGELNQDQDYSFTLPGNNTYVETNFTLEHEEKLNQTMHYSVAEEGSYRLSFFLLRDDEVYRNLHIWIEIRD